MNDLSKTQSKHNLYNYLQRALKAAFYVCTSITLLFILAFILFNWLFLPNINNYRHNIEKLLSNNSGYQVKIESISAKSHLLSVDIFLSKIELSADKQPPMIFSNIEIIPSWLSLIDFEPRFSLIKIEQPNINLRLDSRQKLYINGLNLSREQNSSEKKIDSWILRQQNVVINQARITWQDDYHKIAPISLSNGSINLSSDIFSSHHQLQIQAEKISGLADGFRLNANWYGNNLHNWRNWYGDTSISVKSLHNGAWSEYIKPWFQIISINGSANIRASFRSQQINALNGNFSLHDLCLKTNGYDALTLINFSGNLSLQHRAQNSFALQLDNLNMASKLGNILQTANLELEYNADPKNNIGKISLNKINIASLQPFIIAIDQKQKTNWANLHPKGTISNLFFNWIGDIKELKSYKTSAQFSNLSLNKSSKAAGFTGLTGSINASNDNGYLKLDSHNGSFITSIFSKPLNFNSLQTLVNWSNKKQELEVNIDSLNFSNDDLSAKLNGKYKGRFHGNGSIDLRAQLGRLKAINVKKYIPLNLGENIKNWLKQAFVGGEVTSANMILRGNLDKFPFSDGKSGLFKVNAQLNKVNLQYAQHWPQINNIVGQMEFLNQKMQINAEHATSEGSPLSKVQVKIDDLSSSSAKLSAKGDINETLSKMLEFAGKMPINKSIGNLLRSMKGKGAAKLNLQLNIPLNNTNKSSVNGDISLNNNNLFFSQLPIPELTKINGKLHFNEKGVTSNKLFFSAFGGRFSLKASIDKKQRFELEGNANSKLVASRYLKGLAPFISGTSIYKAKFSIYKGLEQLNISSNLYGTVLKAPSLLFKTANTIAPLQINLMPKSAGLLCSYSLDKRSSGILNMSENGNLINGLINIGNASAIKIPASAIAINIELPSVNFDEISSSIFRNSTQKQKTSSHQLTTAFQINLKSANVYVYGHQLHEVFTSLRNNTKNQSWQAEIKSNEMNGDIYYFPSEESKIKVHLQRFDLYTLVNQNSKQTSDKTAIPSFEMPDISINIDKLLYKNNELGRLSLKGELLGNIWIIPNLSLINTEGSLDGSIEDYRGANPHVATKFVITSSNIGNLLSRFGIKDSILNGHGVLTGKINWPGKFIDFKEDKLSGNLKLNMLSGQFLKVDPGAARILGVLSLQSLWRRMRFNFSDIFEKGFAFDSIIGSATATDGIFKTEDLILSGPSANVTLTGNVDLQQNTQQLIAKVTPHVSGSFALTAATVTLNPFIGLGTFFAQKILQDPFSKMLSQQYEISGSLQNPSVKKIDKQSIQHKDNSLKTDNLSTNHEMGE